MTKGSRSKSLASMNSRGALPSQGLGFITDTYQMHVEQQERRTDKHKQSKQKFRYFLISVMMQQWPFI